MGDDNNNICSAEYMAKKKLNYGYPKFKWSSFSSNLGLGKLYYEFNFKDFIQGKILDKNIYI